MNADWLTLPVWAVEAYVALCLVRIIVRLTPTKKDDWIGDMIEQALGLITPGFIARIFPNLSKNQNGQVVEDWVSIDVPDFVVPQKAITRIVSALLSKRP